MADQSKKPDPQPDDRPEGNKGNTFDPSYLRLSQNFRALSGVRKVLTVVPVRKPGKQEFIRVHPDPAYQLQTALLEFKEEGETFLVAPDLWPQLPGELVAKVLYTYVTAQGIVRLWPIRLPDEDGKLDDWNQSALEAADLAKHAWIRVSSNRAAGMYETFEAIGELPPPRWPELPFAELLNIAFRGKYITDMGYPALRRLRGEL